MQTHILILNFSLFKYMMLHIFFVSKYFFLLIYLCATQTLPHYDSYNSIILLVLCWGSFPIARHIHVRWLQKNMSIVGTNAIIKGVIVLLGISIIPIAQLFTGDWYKEINAITLGVFLALLVIKVEADLIRKSNRKKLLSSVMIAKNVHLPKSAIITKKISLTSSSTKVAKGFINIRQTYHQYADELNFMNYHPLASILVALTEEILFRGFPYYIGFHVQIKIMSQIILFISTLLFALSHTNHSWREFIYKLPLAIATTSIFMATHTLSGAMALHVIVNIHAYLALRKFNFAELGFTSRWKNFY